MNFTCTERSRSIGIDVCFDKLSTGSFAQGLGVKTKTDHTDADSLARYALLVQPPAWQPPPPQYRQLQILQARKQALETDLQHFDRLSASCERNRLEKQQATRSDLC